MPTDQERREEHTRRLRLQTTTAFDRLEDPSIDAQQPRANTAGVMQIPWGAGLGQVAMTPEQQEQATRDPGSTVPITFRFWRWEIVNVFQCADPDKLIVEADAV